MPANIILINGVMEFIVPDSKMKKLIAWLSKNASSKPQEVDDE